MSDLIGEASRLFGEIAVAKGFITAEQLSEALKERNAAADPIRLGQVLIRKRLITSAQMVEILNEQGKALWRCPKCGARSVATRHEGEGPPVCSRCGEAMVASASDPGSNAQVLSPSEIGAVTRLGRFEVRRQIARGGMGIVLEAYDPELKRRVALKVLAAEGASEQTIHRLHREAAIAAKLRHPNIVAVYEIGTDRGRHFIVMDLIEGGTLATLASKMARRDLVAMIEVIARAVDYAHKQGVVHRDLKPGNILIDRDGKPLVADFGLARSQEATQLTVSGAVMGTTYYMAPEQVLGKTHELGPAIDVWALGVILYEIVSGEVPFSGATPAEIYQKILTEEPKPIPGELGRIIAKALEKEPRRRFASAAELADELKRWLEGEPIRTRPASRVYRVWRRVRRNPISWSVSAVLTAALILTVVVLVGQNLRSKRAARARVLLEQAQALVEAGEMAPRDSVNLERARALLNEALDLDPQVSSAHSLLGRIHMHRNDRDTAIREFGLALRQKPNAHDFYRRGLLLGSQEDLQKAIDLGLPTKEEGIHAEAALLLAKGEANRAEQLCQLLLEKRAEAPYDLLRRLEPKLWTLIGECHVKRGNKDEAKACFERVEEILRRDAPAMFRRARALFERFLKLWYGPGMNVDEWVPGSPKLLLLEHAIIDCVRAIEIDPEKVEYRYECGQMYQLRARVAVRTGRDPMVYVRRGIDELTRVLERQDHADAYNHRGVCHQYVYEYRAKMGGDLMEPLDAAIQDFHAAVRLRPQELDPNCSLSVNLYRKIQLLEKDGRDASEQYRLLIEACTNAIDSSPNHSFFTGDGQAYLFRGIAWMRLGDTTRGARDLKEAISKNSAIKEMIPKEWLELVNRVSDSDDY